MGKMLKTIEVEEEAMRQDAEADQYPQADASEAETARPGEEE